MRAVATLALASTMAATPACSSLRLGETRIENPVAAARGADQQAYALLQTYAAIVEAATEIARDPDAPAVLKRSLAQAERAATPSVEALGIAVRAYVRAREDLAASPSDSAAQALSIAASRLVEAVDAARAPISDLEALVRAADN